MENRSGTSADVSTFDKSDFLAIERQCRRIQNSSCCERADVVCKHYGRSSTTYSGAGAGIEFVEGHQIRLAGVPDMVQAKYDVIIGTVRRGPRIEGILCREHIGS